MPASTDLDTSVTIGDKIVRTADGAYLSLAGAAPVLLATTDRAWNMPVGSKIRVTGTSPVLFTSEIRVPNPTNLSDVTRWSVVSTVALTTSISTVLAGLDTWNDLVGGAPTT